MLSPLSATHSRAGGRGFPPGLFLGTGARIPDPFTGPQMEDASAIGGGVRGEVVLSLGAPLTQTTFFPDRFA